ncbi:MAG: carboxypeptidase-like regulatory domain-containing protein [Bacteroidota bacterium]|nr:carboxypeptidase-like regulatory domain-containing protein [Bacteroidota bacterium]
MTRIIGCLFLLLLFRTADAQNEENSVLMQKITIKATNIPVSDILDEISRKGKVFFSYSPDLIPSDRKATLNLVRKQLKVILDSLFPQDSVRFSIINRQIIIHRKEPIKSVIPTSPLRIRGKVLDRLNGMPLSFVNIAVKGKTIGTITNSDGDFLLKLEPSYANDTLLFSYMGYRRLEYPVPVLAVNDFGTIFLETQSIKLPEIKVHRVDITDIMNRLFRNIKNNYPQGDMIMTSFYRESIKVDKRFTSVSEAVFEILKSSYNDSKPDKIKMIKGRKSQDLVPYRLVNFKIQGGPNFVNQLDVIKTRETFLDELYSSYYRYELKDLIIYNQKPTYVVSFKPNETSDFPLYFGELYIDADSYALVQAKFSLTKSGLVYAQTELIKKITRNIRAKPFFTEYTVSYIQIDDLWYINAATCSVKFKVRTTNQLVNSIFHSTVDLLITDRRKYMGESFETDNLFKPKFVFSDMIRDYDESFWGNYNVIQPDDDLRKAIRFIGDSPRKKTSNSYSSNQ